MKTWKTAEGSYLIEGDMGSIPMGTEVPLPDGRTIHKAAPYTCVSPKGQVLRVYLAPMVYSLDDTLGIPDIHAVVEDTLFSLHWIDHAINEPVVKIKVELDGLEPCDPGELPIDLEQIVRK